MMNGNEDVEVPPYIVVNYTPDQAGQIIQDRDMVRPSNHRWCMAGGIDTGTWHLRSTARCPTYGSCTVCLKAGPVGLPCNECDPESRKAGYVVLAVDREKHYDVPGMARILDSITLAKQLGLRLQPAMADRRFVRDTDHIVILTPSKFDARVRTMYMNRNIHDPRVLRVMCDHEYELLRKMVECRSDTDGL